MKSRPQSGIFWTKSAAVKTVNPELGLSLVNSERRKIVFLIKDVSQVPQDTVRCVSLTCFHLKALRDDYMCAHLCALHLLLSVRSVRFSLRHSSVTVCLNSCAVYPA